MPSTLIVFYSFTGNSRRVAQLLSAQQGWPIGEILEARSRTGGIGTLRCVLDSLLGREPAVRYSGPDPASFERVVLVAPVWMHQLASPMRSFIAGTHQRVRAYAVVMTMGSIGATNAEREIARLVGSAPLLSTAVRARSVEDGSCAGALQAFGDALCRLDAAEPVRPAELSPGTA